jgi:hypothetical protein
MTLGVAVALGAGAGAAIGVATGHLAPWLAIGAGADVVFGLLVQRWRS